MDWSLFCFLQINGNLSQVFHAEKPKKNKCTSFCDYNENLNPFIFCCAILDN